MKSTLLILRYLMTWEISTLVTCYLGLCMLPLVFLTGMFWPRFAFGPVGATFLLAIKPQLLLHYPLLLLALNANTSYYCICARIKGWSLLPGFILFAATWFFAAWIAAESVRMGTSSFLIALEAVLLGFALAWRQLARMQFNRVDWQALKPVRTRRGASS